MSANYRDRVASHFRAHPGKWIDGDEFRNIGGKYAYRTRISNCRLELGMQIDNRKRRTHGGPVISEYRYVPAAPMGEATPHDLNVGFSLR